MAFIPVSGGTRASRIIIPATDALATSELGEFQMNWWIKSVADVIRAVKADQNSLRLQNEFYDKAQHPLDTKAIAGNNATRSALTEGTRTFGADPDCPLT